MINTSEIQPSLSIGDCTSRAFELLLVFIISASAFGLGAALAGFFDAKMVVIASLIVTIVYGHVIKSVRFERDSKLVHRNWFYIAMIILVSLFLRAIPFHYVFGGQDQGVYVNIASSIERTGSVKATDPVIDNMFGPHLERYLNENYRSAYLPGIYRTSDASGNTKVEFQFYHLFPVWMAIFEGLFGSEAGVYALTFLSIVSLIFCYQFVRIVAGSDLSGFVASMLLALSPLHVFFSKWPVTEVPTLLFSLAAFSCFAMYWFSDRSEWGGSNRFLILSALSFGCLFATRISGFMYMPSLIVLFSTVALRGGRKDKLNSIALWAGGIFLLYAISVWYGLVWSSLYSNDIYRLSFSRIFGETWPVGVLSLSLVFLLAFVLIFYSAKTTHFRGILVSAIDFIDRRLKWLVVIVLAAGIYKIYQLGFTDRYVNDPWIGQLWGLANKGRESVLASSLVATAIAVSPMIFILFLYFMFVEQKDGAVRIAKFFLLSFFSYVALLQFFVPYQPYYDRYLLSELVPYMIIFVVWGWALMDVDWRKKIVSGLLLTTVIYSGFLTLLHIGKEEQRGAYGGLSNIVSEVGENDLILLHGDDLWDQIKTPLVYKFGKKVVSVSSESLSDKNYLTFLGSMYDNIYLLSSTPDYQEGLKYLGVRRVLYDMFDRTRFPANRVTTKNYKLWLYKLDGSGNPHALRMYGINLNSLSSTTGDEFDGKKVTNGKPGFLVYGPYAQLPPAEYRLVVHGKAKKAQTAWVDVISDKGNIQHGRLVLSQDAQEPHVLAKGQVKIEKEAQDVEVRVYVGADDEIILNGYELVPINEEN